jgi:hypothetical protein
MLFSRHRIDLNPDNNDLSDVIIRKLVQFTPIILPL